MIAANENPNPNRAKNGTRWDEEPRGPASNVTVAIGLLGEDMPIQIVSSAAGTVRADREVLMIARDRSSAGECADLTEVAEGVA